MAARYCACGSTLDPGLLERLDPRDSEFVVDLWHRLHSGPGHQVLAAGDPPPPDDVESLREFAEARG